MSTARIEWQTLLLAIVIHGAWLAATWWHDRLPVALQVAIGGWLIAWHGSLQHETIHGHPTGNRTIDGLIGSAPLSLWLPYAVYRRSHLAHHRSPAITDPFDDPESRYLPQVAGVRGKILRLVERAQATLIGRLLIGPPIAVVRFLGAELERARHAPAATARDWLPHLAAVAALLGWLQLCGLGLGHYLLTFVYPGTALSLLRSFAEHRAAAAPGHRVAIVEQAGPLAWLFLHNNLHAAHHRAPRMAWYRLPAFYRRHRASLLTANGGLLYRGYGEVARRYLFRAHDTVIHPDHRSA